MRTDAPAPHAAISIAHPPTATSALPKLARLLAAALLATVAAVGIATGSAAPASAHDELTGKSLNLNETSGELESLTLHFSDSALDIGHEIHVTNGDGTDVTDGAPTVNGRDVTQALVSDLAPGPYSVAWRVVSSDGHPIEGFFAFMVTEGSAPEWIPEGDAQVPAETPTPEGTDDTPEQNHDHEAPTDHEGAHTAENAAAPIRGWEIGLIVAGVALAVAGTVIAVIVSSKRRARALAEAGTASEQSSTDTNGADK